MTNKLYSDPLGNTSDISFNNIQNYFNISNTYR